jgi:chromosome segregation ATPase
VAPAPAPSEAPAGTVRLQSVVRVGGPFAPALRAAIGDALIAESFETASHVAPLVAFPVATLEGDVFRGRHVVTGGDKAESRGILATKREIKELRERIAAERTALAQLADETTQFEQTIAHATAAIQALGAEIHRQEKAIVSVEAQVSRAAQDEFRVAAARRPGGQREPAGSARRLAGSTSARPRLASRSPAWTTTSWWPMRASVRPSSA